MKTKTRNVNMDLLRIVSMLLIVLLHSIDHSGVLEEAIDCSSVVDVYVMYVYAFTRVCVNCYVLLGGYFLVKSKFRLHKLIVLWLEVVINSIVIKLIFMLLGQTPFSIVSLASCFFPVVTGRYWFVTIYFAMYILSPFLNKIIFVMSKKEFTLFNIVLCVLFSTWSSIHPAIAGVNSGGGWGLAWFVVLYFAAAWFRLYYNENGRFKVKLLAVFMLPVITTILFVVSSQTEIGLFKQVANQWCRYDSIPVYAASLLLFSAFINIKIKNVMISKLIALISPATFGVYLIHAHADFDSWVWSFTGIASRLENTLFPLYQLGIVVCLFTVCALIAIIRKKVMTGIENAKMLVCVENKVTTLLEKFANRL